MINSKGVHSIRLNWTTDAYGTPLALVIYTNRTWNTFYHEELGA